MEQWDSIQSPEIAPHTQSQPIFDKGAKASQRREDSLFNNSAGKTGVLM